MKCLIRHGGLWLLFLSCFLPAASGQNSGSDKVSQIIVTNVGPAAASQELIRANIHLKPGDLYVRASVDDDVKNLYGTGFFYNIQVRDRLTSEGVVVTYVLEGTPKLTHINFEGNTLLMIAGGVR